MLPALACGGGEGFAAVQGEAAADVLPACANPADVAAGRWPHNATSSRVAASRAITAGERRACSPKLREFRSFLEAPVRRCAARRRRPGQPGSTTRLAAGRTGDFRFPGGGQRSWPGPIGRADDAFRRTAPTAALGGTWQGVPTTSSSIRSPSPKTPAAPAGRSAAAPSGAGRNARRCRTRPRPTWCKAPRWRPGLRGRCALARQFIAGHPLSCDMVSRSGGSVMARVAARLLELAPGRAGHGKFSSGA